MDVFCFFFFFSSRRRHTRYWRDWSSDVCSSELADASYRRGAIATPAGACRWTTASATLAGQTVSLVGQAACPWSMRSLHWELPVMRDARVSPAFQVLVKAVIAGEEHLAIVDRARPSLDIARASPLGFGDFVWTG